MRRVSSPPSRREVGQVMAQGQGVIRLARLDELEILVGVPEHRLKVVREAKGASFELWSDPGRRHSAKLRELSPSADPVTRTYAARFSVIDPPEFFGLGMTATLGFERPRQHACRRGAPLLDLPARHAARRLGRRPHQRHGRTAARDDRALARRHRRHFLGREGRRADRHRRRAQARDRAESESRCRCSSNRRRASDLVPRGDSP